MDLNFRRVFERSRPQPSPDDSSELDQIPRRAHRAASYISLRSNTSTTSAAATLDTFFSARAPENLYHKPSSDMMAEELKVVMMRNPTLSSVPIEYNSCILHVLEAYHDLREQLKTKDKDIIELQNTHTIAIKEFEDLAEQWVNREQDYKNELKKLEVLLANTEGGMEKVHLARSKSVVYGSRRQQDVIRDELDKIKKRSSDLSSHGEQSTIPMTPSRPGPQTPQQKMTPGGQYDTGFHNADLSMFGSGTRTKPSAYSPRPKLSLKQESGARYSRPEPKPKLEANPMEAMQHLETEREMGLYLGSSESDGGGSGRAEHGGFDARRKLFGEKQTPKPVPLWKHQPRTDSEDRTDANRSPDRGISEPIDGGGFSFAKGDDLVDLLAKTKYVMSQKQMIAEFTTKKSRVDSSPKSKNYDQQADVMRNTESSTKAKQLRFSTSLGNELGREDSSSSVVTAVRDDSGRNTQAERPKMNRKNHSRDEAIIAANKALAGDHRQTDSQGKMDQRK